MIPNVINWPDCEWLRKNQPSVVMCAGALPNWLAGASKMTARFLLGWIGGVAAY